MKAELLAHAPRLFRLAARLLGNTADAEDVVHDVFVKALAASAEGSFRGEASVLTWLYRCTMNVALDRKRTKARVQAHADTTHRESATSETQAQALAELSQALSLLPDDQRAALVLKELQGLTAKEVASVMERSEGAIEQLLDRARATLRGSLEP